MARSTGSSSGNPFPDVVVTGIAMTTALATDAEGTWKRLLDGESGIRTLDDYFVELYDLPVRIGGHLLEDFEGDLTQEELGRLSYLQRMSTVIGRRAWENAGSPDVDTRRLLVSIGTGMGSSEELLYAYDAMREKGFKAVSPLAVQMYMPNSPAAAVGLERNARAGVVTPVSACASGSEAIANAWRNIVLGEADVAICGGVETRIEAVPIAGFAQMRIVLSTTNEDPAGACRPFDKDRNGFVFGEGGALMVLETEQHARARGANILARLMGAGVTSATTSWLRIRRVTKRAMRLRGPFSSRDCSPATSTTSTRTRPEPRSATWPKARPSTTRSAATDPRCTHRSRLWATPSARSARWNRS
jgi:beta-ketoacyl ACP synthase